MTETAFPTTPTTPTSDESNGLPYMLVARDDGKESLTIFIPGEQPIVVDATHPNFERLRDGAVTKTLSADEARRLEDMSQEADQQFRRITDRVSVANGRVYFDGDQVHGSLAQQIVRFIDAGVEDWKPLVAFMEKVAQNPTDHSREQLYDWLSARDFTITDEGNIIAYKGVMRDGNGEIVSIHSGPGIVNGKQMNGHLPNPTGAVIEIARSYVTHDPAIGCHQGLHVGTYDYAHGFAQGVLLKVEVNPRDVVSVPTDCGFQKMRVCRYRVLEQIDAPETEPVVSVGDEFRDDDWHWEYREEGRDDDDLAREEGCDGLGDCGDPACERFGCQRL